VFFETSEFKDLGFFPKRHFEREFFFPPSEVFLLISRRSNGKKNLFSCSDFILEIFFEKKNSKTP